MNDGRSSGVRSAECGVRWSRATRGLTILVMLLMVSGLQAQDAVEPLGDPVLDPPTCECLGVYWLVRGDDKRTVRIDLAVRRAGSDGWKACLPLLRVEKGAHRRAGKADNDSSVKVPDDGWLFAGSVMFLAPDTAYELRLRLIDPSGGKPVERIIKAHTVSEPVVSAQAPRKHVAPGTGGGDGTAASPFRGLLAAQATAKPGDVFVVHAGVYPPFVVSTSGELRKPIVWQGAGDGETMIDGGGKERAISASDLHDVWFEGLSLRAADFALVLNGSTRAVVRRCHFNDVGYGITNGRNDQRTVTGCFITDNVLDGRMRWLLLDTPEGDAQWHQETRAIEMTGSGHVIARNRISHFKDAIDTCPSPQCVAIDICDNELSQLIDDGIELDGSERNVRCFRNRITDCHTGISVQPVFGGPVYAVRNAIYNVQSEPFKMHNSPSGAYFLHNTVVKRGALLVVSTPEPLSNVVLRNNLFIGSAGRAVHFDPTVTRGDFDYDGFGGWNGDVCMKWLGVKYATIDEVHAKAPIERHAVSIDPATAFASNVSVPADQRVEHPAVDLRLKAGSAAIDAGEPLPGINDGFAGKAPDLGAYELDESPKRYGPSASK